VKNDVLVGFARLRFPSRCLRREITRNSAIIRELHVYGETAAIGEKTDVKSQHKGYGRKLLETAEKIAKQHKKHKMIVISGIGVREYYRKLGYKKEGPYMVKRI
jgi:elongator complex protein 3